jgi:hypothetical protein
MIEFIDQQLLVCLSLNLVGNIVTLNKYAGDFTIWADNGLINKIEVTLFLTVWAVAQHNLVAPGDMSPTGAPYAVEQRGETLLDHLRQRLGNTLADKKSLSHKISIGAIGHAEYMARAIKHSDKTRRLFKQGFELIALLRKIPVSGLDRALMRSVSSTVCCKMNSTSPWASRMGVWVALQ